MKYRGIADGIVVSAMPISIVGRAILEIGLR